jgi:ornithine carbamoyltransferase
MKRDFISLQDYEPAELYELLNIAREIKAAPDEYRDSLKGKTLGMIFQKSSTRTRVSFEVGMYQLGGIALFLSANELQLGRGETIADTAKVLSRYLDAIMARTYSHQDIVELAKNATIPVINGLSDLLHPCQALADYLTIMEKKGQFQGIKLAYIGDGNNVCHSLLIGASKFGINISIATPINYEPSKDIVNMAKENSKQSGASIYLSNDAYEAAANADVIYTDVWVSMGQEKEKESRLKAFQGFQINSKLLSYAKKDVIFMHCLPAHRGEEVSDEVIDGEHSVVFDQAENRLHAQKAILLKLLGE